MIIHIGPVEILDNTLFKKMSGELEAISNANPKEKRPGQTEDEYKMLSNATFIKFKKWEEKVKLNDELTSTEKEDLLLIARDFTRSRGYPDANPLI